MFVPWMQKDPLRLSLLYLFVPMIHLFVATPASSFRLPESLHLKVSRPLVALRHNRIRFQLPDLYQTGFLATVVQLLQPLSEPKCARMHVFLQHRQIYID